MLADLDRIHDVLMDAYKALMLLSGIDLDAQVKEFTALQENGEAAPSDEGPIFHLPL
jgi:hypothetical protein